MPSHKPHKALTEAHQNLLHFVEILPDLNLRTILVLPDRMALLDAKVHAYKAESSHCAGH